MKAGRGTDQEPEGQQQIPPPHALPEVDALLPMIVLLAIVGEEEVAVDPAAVQRLATVARDRVVGDRRGGGVAVDPAAVGCALLPVIVLLVIVGEEESQ